MTTEQYFKNLTPPKGKIDVILDTDAYNEIDDQYAICYLLANSDKLNTLSLCAAPFLNTLSESPLDGMEKSYREILKLLTIMGREDLGTKVLKGSDRFLPDQNTPVYSDAAEYMAKTACNYSPENPLYIVAIGAITNVASAILMNPAMKENCVIVWLGGHAAHMPEPAGEFNMVQDISAARVVMGCGVPFVQLPALGVVEAFATTEPELTKFLLGKNKICEYLCNNTVSYCSSRLEKAWSKAIWDVTAVAWLINENERFMSDVLVKAPMPQTDLGYSTSPKAHFVKQVYHINRDALFSDLFEKLTEL